MRIMDVQKFVGTQFEEYKERRVSQYTRFLDKSVEFYTYYAINKQLSTTEIGNFNIDSYIGKDSPVRYNKINNFPMYGFPTITNYNDYDESNAGFSGDVENEVVMLQEVLEPSEGDCFIMPSLDKNYFFIVTSVEQRVLYSKPYYVLRFTLGIPDYLPQLNCQVVDEFNAIFDNIGTQDKVVISHKEYSLLDSYLKIYSTMVDYYKTIYFKPKITMFEIFKNILPCGRAIHYTDKFLSKFMEKNRIIVMDQVLRSSLMLDYNALYKNDGDYREYRKSIYAAIENKDINDMALCKYIGVNEVVSPFALVTGETDTPYYTSTSFVVDPPSQCMYRLLFDNSEIIDKYNKQITNVGSTHHEKFVSIIVKYFRDIVIEPGYFEGLLDNECLEEYMMIPIILFILRHQINGLTSKTNILYR